VEAYLAQHDVEPVTIETLRWLFGKAVAVFGDRPVGELRSQEIAAWRIALSPGYRFDATQALRQVLSRAVLWGMLDVNPAKLGVDNPSPRRREQRPFESWAELDAVAANLSSRYRPMAIFAAATGLRPAEWLALERRDVDPEAQVVYVCRSFTKGRLKCTKTEASRRAVPLQAIALDAIERQSSSPRSPLVFPAERGGYLDHTTSATASGSRHNVPPGSSLCAGSTIFGTPSRPSRSVPAFPPSICPATWAPA
jgi:integrase